MTSKTLVTLSENILTIKGVPVTLPFGNYTSPQIFYINDTIYISITNVDNSKVYLFFSKLLIFVSMSWVAYFNTY